MALTLPLASPTMRCGAARNTNFAPSSSAAAVSSSMAGMSLRFAAVENGHIAALAQRGARGIDGGIASADDRDPASRDCTSCPAATASRKWQRRIDALQLGARQVDPRFFPRADGEEDHVEVVIEVVERTCRRRLGC